MREIRETMGSYFFLQENQGYNEQHNKMIEDNRVQPTRQTQMGLNQHQQQYFDLIQEFFEDDVVPYEICLFFGVVPGKGTLVGHSAFVWCCSISSDDSLIVSGSEDKTLKLWNIETGEEMKTFRGHSDWMDCCSISSQVHVLWK